MEYLILLIPVIACIILLIFFRKQTVWWEYFLVIVPSVILVLLLRFSFELYLTQSTEYFSYYYVKARHLDAWNEWIHKTCTRRIPTGRIKGRTTYRTETYDCSYCQEHPERWVLIDNNGNETYTTEIDFNRIIKKWKANAVFVDMHRHFYTKDGDAHDYNWDNNKLTAETYTVAHNYNNKIKASRSVFKFKEISDDDARIIGLYPYPPVIDRQQNPIIGLKNETPLDVNSLRFVNAYLGKIKEFRTFLIFFYDKPASISELQRSYWFGGNKNEFITCVGLNSSDNSIEWINCFSWMDNQQMSLDCESYFRNRGYMDVPEYSNWIMDNVNKWKRKEFSDFNYLEVELTDTQYTWMLILTLLYTIGISLYVILNDIKNEKYEE